MIISDNIETAKKLIKKESKPVIVLAQNLEFNRKIIEYGHFDLLLSPENNTNKTNLRTIDSGLNEFLAKLAAKNKVAIGIDLEKLRNENKKNKGIILSKLRQNIKLCRKSNATIKLINIKDKKDAASFLISLGASSLQAKEAIAF